MISFSNRCFPSKVIAVWFSSYGIGMLIIVGSYFRHSEKWKGIEVFDMLENKEVVRPSVMDVSMDPSRA